MILVKTLLYVVSLCAKGQSGRRLFTLSSIRHMSTLTRWGVNRLPDGQKCAEMFDLWQEKSFRTVQKKI